MPEDASGQPMRDFTVLEIDLNAVAHNMAVLKRVVGPRVGVCPVVKADAYGLGAARLAPALMAGGAEMLAVYTAAQAAELFRAATVGPVLVMMPVRALSRGDELEHALVRGRLHLSVHDRDQLRDLIRISERYTTPLAVHLDVDTGMTRGGCDLEDAPELLAAIAAAPRLRLAGISTHFASAESDLPGTERQLERLEDLLEAEANRIPADCIVHAANTAAMIRSKAFHRRMVRVGQAWAGYGSELFETHELLPGASDLRACVSLTSEIIQLKRVPARTKVGYGGTWTARRPSLIGLVPVGYADGYPLALSRSSRRSENAPRIGVIIEEAGGCTCTLAPVIGRINMDQISVDLTEIDEAGHTLRVGTKVELISADLAPPHYLVRLAAAAKTSPYELLCRLSPRLRRSYHRAASTIEVLPARRDAGVAETASAVAGRETTSVP